MLAMKDWKHEVTSSVPGLAHLASVSVEDCRLALAKFLAPDPDSRTSEFDGRRIESIPGGWRILNGEYYRQLLSEEDRREKNREYKRKQRAQESAAAARILLESKGTPMKNENAAVEAEKNDDMERAGKLAEPVQ